MLGHYFLARGQKIWQASKCSILRLEIWLLLHSDCDELRSGKLDRAIALQKQRDPDRTQIWYLEQIIKDLRAKN